MATDVVDDLDGHPSDLEPAPADPGPPKRRRLAIVLAVVGATGGILLLAASWFVLSRDQPTELGTDQALDEFRAANASSGEADGRPAAGVYAATATGVESIGLPGFDEELGPNAPVTVTHGDAGCFTYRADFNSHHWRSWTFCPTATASFAMTTSDAWTARKAPGLDIATLATYDCKEPVGFLWSGAAVGDTRSGACTGVNDVDDAVTEDAATVEVLGTDTLTVGGDQVDVVHVRSTEIFSGDQTGREIDEWWLDASTGLPVRVVVDSQLTGGLSDYAETADLTLSTLRPST